MKVAVLIPDGAEFDAVTDAVQAAVGTIPDTDGTQKEELEIPYGEVSPRILDVLREADAVVADVSRNRPNILFEIGFAHALSRPIAILFSTDSEEPLPLDLAAFQVITYDPANMSALTDRLHRYLAHVGTTREESLDR